MVDVNLLLYISSIFSFFFLKENINNRKNIVCYLLIITSLLACLFVSSEPHIRQSVWSVALFQQLFMVLEN